MLRKMFTTDAYPQKAKDYQAFLTDGLQRCWVAVDDGRIIGHVGIGAGVPTSDLAVRIWKQKRPDDDDIAVVKRLYVDPDARNRGVAAALMGATESWGRTVRIRLVLFVLIKDRDAIQLYRKLRWEEYGTGMFQLDDEKEMEAICFVNPA